MLFCYFLVSLLLIGEFRIGYTLGKLTTRIKVQLDYGSFIGKRQNLLGLERFWGIPFAEPPVGDLRLRNPIKPRGTYWNRDCTRIHPGCPQQSFGGNTSTSPYKSWVNDLKINPLAYLKPLGPGKEDCLTLDIARPAGVDKNARLPVMYWIFPGGFNFGTSWELTPGSIVKKSISMGLPIIHVSANHRMNAFGFLGGREVFEAGIGNLGLKDQRLTLEWIQTYISEFGGDPSKVTIYGESSGGISVSNHLLAYGGQHNGLFRAAIAQSGTATPSEKLSDGSGQAAFDHIVQNVGSCANATDKLQCLRYAPYKEILRVVGHFPGTFSFGAFPLTFGPAVDGTFVTESMQKALAAGRYAKVPLISGNVWDEGTVLTLNTYPLRNETALRNYLTERLPRSTPEMMSKILSLWPTDPSLGSPFETGRLDAITPVYKQYAAILGDVGFQGLRRFYLTMTSPSVPSWSYIDKAFAELPIFGAFHGSELPSLFGFLPGDRKEEYQTRWIAFANNLNPNFPGLVNWTTYDQGHSNLVINLEGAKGMEPDTFRKEAIDYFMENIDSFVLSKEGLR